MAPAAEPQLTIRRARGADAAGLTGLALAAKAVWGYDAAFMAACRAELTVRPESIARDPTYLIETDGQIVGFYQLRIAGARADVFMIFVAPGTLRAGLGRRLWAHLEDTVRAAGATRVEVDSDPHAEGFYRAMGMRRVGEAPSGSIPGRMLPHLIKELAPDIAGGGGGDDKARSDLTRGSRLSTVQEPAHVLERYFGEAQIADAAR